MVTLPLITLNAKVYGCVVIRSIFIVPTTVNLPTLGFYYPKVWTMMMAVSLFFFCVMAFVRGRVRILCRYFEIFLGERVATVEFIFSHFLGVLFISVFILVKFLSYKFTKMGKINK